MVADLRQHRRGQRRRGLGPGDDGPELADCRALDRNPALNCSQWLGILAGIVAFAAVIFSPVLGMVSLFQTGAFFIGLGGGLFSVGMLTAAMDLASSGTGSMSGFALGAWGGVQATAAGIGVGISGLLRDAVAGLASDGALGAATSPATGYLTVYQIEIVLLFANLAVIGPLVRGGRRSTRQPGFGLAQIPG